MREGPKPPRPAPRGPDRKVQRPQNPPLRIQTTTLWEYPSQHYGNAIQGDARYVGATPSYVIWNVIQRYTQKGDRVIDPMCGSGTTLDVAKDTGRVARGFDLSPYRPDIERADARELPIESGAAQLVFVDPPYGDHIDYSNEPDCIGKLSAYDPRYYEQMGKVLKECARVLAPGGVLAVYVCDFFEKKKGFAPVGLQLFATMASLLEPIDVVSVVRHHKTLQMGNYHRAAEEQNFFLRGFNYLFLARKPEGRRGEPAGRGRSAARRR